MSFLQFSKAIPVIRIFDETRARAFYLDFLGFEIEFKHRYAGGMQLYFFAEIWKKQN